MSIKRKKKGPMPTFPERWQTLAVQPARHTDAMAEYRTVYPKATYVEAHRAVMDFRRKYT